MRKNLFTKKAMENLIYYALCLLAVGITPFLAKPVAPVFDWAGYSLLRPLFEEIFTLIFWAAELVGFYFIRKKWKEVRAKKTEGVSQTQIAETEGANEVQIVEEERVKKGKKEKKEKTPLLPMRNVLILSAIAVVCIFVASAQIGFKVKPVYEIGEKVTGYEIMNKIGMLCRNVMKCVWILLSLHCLHAVASEMLVALPENKKNRLIPVVAGAFLLLFWGVDVLVFERLFLWTYLLFYPAFTAVYYLTDRNAHKTLLLIVLIYLF